MSTSFFFLIAAVLPASWLEEPASPFEIDAADESAWVVRAQSPGVVGSPYFGGEPGVAPVGYSTPAIPVQQPLGTMQPYQQGTPYMNPGVPSYPAPIQDPFAGGGYYDPNAMQAPGGYYMRGINGPQPVRYGWSNRFDVTYMPREHTSAPASGGFEQMGIDWQMIHTKPLGNWTWSLGPQFSYRSWQGPGDALGDTDLPGGAYRFGLDMLLRTPTVNGWTLEAGFDPSIASDFRAGLNTDAILYDAHAVAFWTLNPKWTLAMGVLYWDRVDSIILPYAGAIWTPNDIWEFRLIFPKPRISVFLGTPMGVPTWMYVGAEYHVEAYEVKPKTFERETRMQMADWRVAGGLKWETGWLTSFAEAGYIFDRKVEYERIGENFRIGDGFMARIGFRY